jgi:hypothetical protein
MGLFCSFGSNFDILHTWLSASLLHEYTIFPSVDLFLKYHYNHFKYNEGVFMVLFWFFRSKRLVQLFMTFFSVCRISLAGPALHVLRALLDLRIPHMANNVCVTLLCGIQKHSLRLWMSDLVCLSQNTMTTIHGCSPLSKIHAISILADLLKTTQERHMAVLSSL